ncbi:alanine racemase [Candidatus Saccharibacteria bacterium]|nr:alanine racemase [Candidatus Saccharibacteria bacterium]
MNVGTKLKQLWPKTGRQFKVFNQIILDKKAVRHNLEILRQIGGTDVMPVLKSNAYEHGIRQMAAILRELAVPMVAVDGYYEATAIRRIFKGRILVLGVIRRENVGRLRNHRISYVLQNIDDLRAFGQTGRKFNIHLEINTGMNRLGLRPEEIAEYLRVLEKYQNLHLEGVMTHLASADDPDSDSPEQQVEIFDQAVREILDAGHQPEIIHVANSAGVGRVNSRFANYIRPGLAVYGLSELPENDDRSQQFSKLRPVLELRSTIVKTINLRKGEAVGYGGSFIAPQTMRIGVLPLGYYEGIPRALSNRGLVTSLSGRELDIVGRVCMNHTMIDLSDADLGEGDEVVIISRDPKARNSVHGLEREFDLFAYETLARLSENIRRVVE